LILNESKSIDIGIDSFLKFSKKWEKSKFLNKLGVNNIILSGIMLIFSLFGAVFGMSEETIAFIIIFVPLAISMGYDSIVGVSLCFVAAALGFAGAFLNPFTVGIAQGLSNIPLFSGIGYRVFMWLIINITGFIFILRYAAKIHKNPKKSPVYDNDEYWRTRHGETSTGFEHFVPGCLDFIYFSFGSVNPVFHLLSGNPSETGKQHPAFSGTPGTSLLFILSGIISLRKTVHYYILSLLTFTIIFLIIGVMGYNWYFMEIATLFFALGIYRELLSGKHPTRLPVRLPKGRKTFYRQHWWWAGRWHCGHPRRRKNYRYHFVSLSQSMENLGKRGPFR
jgi:uncharacterized ion transporter superfamily protein YfcC